MTETDQAVEAFIKRSIADNYPSFKFIGEESFAGGERVDLTDDPTFIVDPIDGTTNFVSRMPTLDLPPRLTLACLRQVHAIDFVRSPSFSIASLGTDSSMLTGLLQHRLHLQARARHRVSLDPPEGLASD